MLKDINGQTVASKTVTTNAYGSGAGEFVIPSGRALGVWSVQSSRGGAGTIRVEEYKRPTFEVQLTDAPGALRLNRPATLEGDARYYFGLPLTRGEARWRVVREPVMPWWWGGYGRGMELQTRTIAAGTSLIGTDGRFRLTFKAEADERTAQSPDVSYRYVVHADVTDEGGETRSASRSFRLGFASVEATISSSTTFVREGQSAVFTMLRTNLDGMPKAGQATWRVVALQQPPSVLLPAEQPLPPPEYPNAYRTPGDAQRSRWDPGYAPEAVLRAWGDGAEASHGSLTHDAQGEAALTLPTLAPGAWRLHYRTVDDFGTPYTTTQDFIVAAARTPVALPLLLKAESASVSVGGTARLLVHSAIAGLPITIDIEKGGRRIDRRMMVAGQSPAVIELPIGPDDRGGFGVTATALHDHQLMTLTQSVFVPWDDKELKLDFATFRDTLRPGARETWRVTVKKPDGAPAEAGAAELLAYMYDRSLDAFAPHAPPSVLSLYPQRTEVSWVRASLGSAPGLWLWDNGFGAVPAAPSLEGDRLRFFDHYAMGGPGVRRQMMMRGGVAHDMAMSPPPPAPVAAPEMAMEAAAVGSAATSKQSRREGLAAANGALQSAEEGASAPPPVELRSNFAETAFWQPQLLTGADGSATLEFQVPDSVTSWNVWVHAITRDLRGASARREVKTVKDLMVRPYLPRFLRESDEAQLKVLVNNAGKAPLTGDLALEIFDPVTLENLLPAFGIGKPALPFKVAPGGSQPLVFTLKAPRGVRTVAFKLTARAADLSDGEVRALPVLPSRLHLTQSRFAALKGAERRTLTFDDMARTDDASRIDDKLVVTLDAQLFYGVLQALPYLADYPYECTEQTLNRYLSTGIVTSVFNRYPSVAKMAKELSARDTRLETWDSADPNRRMALEETPWVEQAKGGPQGTTPSLRILDPQIAKAEQSSALAKLAKAQTSLGAFPWWPGGPPSPYMTLYTVYGFSKGLEFGVEPPKDVVVRAWQYLHRHYLDEMVQDSVKDDCCWEFVTFMNYTLSNFPDASWTGEVFTDAERKAMLEFSFRHWKEHSSYLKGYLALTLHRMGRHADAMLVFDSLMDSAKSDVDLGTYWAPEDRSWLWYNDTIETHAFGLRALMELKPKDPRRDGMVQWLFLNKQLNHWKSTRATAEVIYSLVHYLQAEGALGAREAARVVVGGRTTDFAFEPDRYTGKAAQVVLEGRELDPKTAANTTVSKDTPGILFASATWHYSTEQLPKEARGDLFGVTRRYFRRENRAGQWMLTPLDEGTVLSSGDELEVQLSIRAKHAAEYVHLRDPRAAGLEPGVALSGYKSDLGLVWYEEIRDSGTNFFFERLPAGEYTLKYRTRASMGGRFRVGPATLQSMYAPEFAAFSAGAHLDVKPTHP
ncbi:MAG TPA: alpha-2-macroglobulin family protein [Vicinamibacterales bacterium]|nr:alpha-2-macroglobulin family protein [Vicinamibacterales bacterium]